MSSVGVVVPAFRPDPDRLVSYCRALESTLSPATIRIELDAASETVVAALADAPATVHAVDRRRGKGAAITAGFDALEEDVRAFVDGDGSTPAASVGTLVDRVAGEEVDLAVGSRRHPDSNVGDHQTRARRRMGDVFAWLARQVLPVTLSDYQCGAKAIDAAAWEGVRPHLFEPGFAWDIELVTVAHALGYRVTEIPVAWRDQPGSTVEPVSTGIELVRALVRSRRRARRLRHAGEEPQEASGPVPLIHRGAPEGSDE